MAEVACPRCNGRGDIPAPRGNGATGCFTCGGRGVIDEKDAAWAAKWAQQSQENAPPAPKTAPAAKRRTSSSKISKKSTAAIPSLAVEAEKKRSELHQHASDGYLSGVREELAASADVNGRDDSGRTPLHWPAYRGHLEVVQLLIENGADINAQDSGGRTPLKMATIGNRQEMIDFLRERGAE